MALSNPLRPIAARAARPAAPRVTFSIVLSVFVGCLGPTTKAAGTDGAAESVWLSALDVAKTQQDWGDPRADKSVEGRPLSVGGTHYSHGLGTHAASTLYVNLGGHASRFTASVGVDDEAAKPPAGVEFEVLGDGKSLWKGKPTTKGQPAEKVDVDLAGVKTLLLLVRSTGDDVQYCHADWADAKIEYDGKAGDKPATFQAPGEAPVVLTPAPAPSRASTAPASSASAPATPSSTRSPPPATSPSATPPTTSPPASPSIRRPASSPASSPRRANSTSPSTPPMTRGRRPGRSESSSATPSR